MLWIQEAEKIKNVHISIENIIKIEICGFKIKNKGTDLFGRNNS